MRIYPHGEIVLEYEDSYKSEGITHYQSHELLGLLITAILNGDDAGINLYTEYAHIWLTEHNTKEIRRVK